MSKNARSQGDGKPSERFLQTALEKGPGHSLSQLRAGVQSAVSPACAPLRSARVPVIHPQGSCNRTTHRGASNNTNASSRGQEP